jgi:hypothetical protein
MSKTKKDEKPLSYGGWVRNLLLSNHDLTLEQLHEAHDKSSWDKSQRPKDKQNIYLAKGAIFKRWGVKTLTELPVNADGSVNMSGMVRLFLKKQGLDSSYNEAVKFFALDGLKLSDALFHNARINLRKRESPDDNQHTGPRIGKPQPTPAPTAQSKPKKHKSSESVDMLLKAKNFVQEIGGIGPARAVIAVLEKLQTQ